MKNVISGLRLWKVVMLVMLGCAVSLHANGGDKAGVIYSAGRKSRMPAVWNSVSGEWKATDAGQYSQGKNKGKHFSALDLPLGDFELKMKLKFAQKWFPVGVQVRAAKMGLWTDSGYKIYVSGIEGISAGTNFNTRQTHKGPKLSLHPNTWYNFRLSVIGKDIKAKIWLAGAEEPSVWHLDFTYPKLSATGKTGLMCLENKACFDKIEIDRKNAPLPKRVSIKGRDFFLDGSPNFPHGMTHAAPKRFSSLAKIGINTISEELSFHDFDPRKSEEENKAAFARYIKIADEAHANGMTMLWLLSFHKTPDWLWKRYPDVRMKTHAGGHGRGSFTSICLDHPGFRADAAKWMKFLTTQLASHPSTVSYLFWNEPHLTSNICYNTHTVNTFHKWLQKRYHTVDKMNKVWKTQFTAFSDVKPPAPRARTHWYQEYDKMASRAARSEMQGAAVKKGNPAVWMDWMRFRQDNFSSFFKWETDIIRANDPDALIASKMVPFELYSSHAYGSATNAEMWARDFLDVIGMDLYPHPDEDFLARWKCDYFLSISQGKPIWHTEFNFSFNRERGLPTAEQWRTAAYYQLARGVNGFWNFMWNDGSVHTLHYKNYKFAPVTHEIVRISKELKKLAPVLAGTKPAPAQVAVLHSTTTSLAVAGDYAPSADQTTIIELLYRSHTPFEFVTEDMIRKGALKKYRVLVAVGTVALSDDVLEQIRKFTDKNGGHVFANARFAELDDCGRKRKQHPPAWMGVKVDSFSRQARKKTGILELRRQARNVDNNPIDVHVKMDTWSSRPIKLLSGEVLGSGNIFGDEDTQFEWSCGNRHEMYWENIKTIDDAKVIGTFEDNKPAIVETPQTLYIARDTCWVDENFEKLFREFLSKSGVLNRNTVILTKTGQPAPSVDLRMWENKKRRILFVINSAPTLHYKGKPVNIEVTFDSFGEVSDALTGKVVPSQWKDFKRVIPLTLKAGEVRVLLGKPYPAGYRAEKQRYKELKEYLQPGSEPYKVWRRSPTELLVYDARPELGIGMHDAFLRENEYFKQVGKLGIRLVRLTLNLDRVENTRTPGVYSQKMLKYYDDIVKRAGKAGVELVFLVHGDPRGTGWANRHEGYKRFADFMRFIVKRYPSVRFWELWNEMDVSFTSLFGAKRPGYPMFERGRCYAQMLKLAYPAIKKANPKAWVVVGGIASSPPSEFIRGLYEEGGRDYFDIIAIHTYGIPVYWRMLTDGYRTKLAMDRYGDFNRPVWDTEFGIDAGNLWNAWKYSSAEKFDQGQLLQWKTCIEDAMAKQLYSKIIPYQFFAGNETSNKQMKNPKAGIKLPQGHTLDDYGFGLLRRDGKTPRPTYDWLLKEQVNSRIQKKSLLTSDVVLEWDGTWKPVDYKFKTSGHKITIKDVKIDSLIPTVIVLQSIK